jgi:hypothetical protein
MKHFFEGFEKQAVSVGTYVKALKGREDRLAKTLTDLTKGNKVQMKKYLEPVKKLESYTKAPISPDIIDTAKKIGISPDASASALRKRGPLSALLSHGKFFSKQKETRNPAEFIRKSIMDKTRQKRKYTEEWKTIKEDLFGSGAKTKTKNLGLKKKKRK